MKRDRDEPSGPLRTKRAKLRDAAPGVLTRERILEAAAEMFAERGVEAVSLRELTLRAGVNLAAVNYHFGSKEGVLAEVFLRSSRPIVKWRLELLEKVERDADGRPSLEQLLDGYMRPALHVGRRQNRSFVRLRARLAIERDEMARSLLAECFDESTKRYIDEIALALPGLPKDELYWRFHFMMGSMFYTMAEPGRILGLSDGACDPGQLEEAMRRMIAVFAAVFREGVPAGAHREAGASPQ